MKRKIVIIGYGISGKAAKRLAVKQGFETVVVDKKPAEDVLPDTADLPLDDISEVILSPGIPLHHPLVQKAKAKNIPVIGEVAFALRYISNVCFGITGANGKTTTVLLTAHILNHAKIKAVALGNVGQALSDFAVENTSDAVVILELSSFQLETLDSVCLDAALVLNITPNHLDRYSSMQEYMLAKAKIQNCLKKKDAMYVSQQVQEEFGAFFPGSVVFEKNIAELNTLSYTQLEMPSKQSVQAAYLLCKRCGVTDSAFVEGLKTFQKPLHRIEKVAAINGTSYYNDSKSSNVFSVMHAISRFSAPVVLIVGGVHKGSSYAPWIPCFQGKVREVIAYGEAAPIIEAELRSAFAVKRIDRFADAVQYAQAIAKPNDTVLLSPGCSSYDQFANFEQRGEEFKRLVKTYG